MSTTDEVFDYIMDSPEDTNPAVLKSLLDSIPESWEPVYFYITITQEESGLYSKDVTFEEILDAYNAKKILLVNAEFEDIGTVPLNCIERYKGDFEIGSFGFYGYSPYGQERYIYIESTDAVYVFTRQEE